MNSGSYNNFLERFTEFKNDPTNDEDMAEREENYLLAQDLIDTPEKIRKLTEKDMFYLLTLFHSGGVERNEGKIAGDMSRFRMYLERALEISSDTTPAAYERAKDLLDSPDVDVSGAGINVRTEIFHTYDPVRFPVLNRNFEKGLLFFHFIESEFSGNKGERYYRCIKIVEEIRQQFSIPNCRELDWFFNYIYWENKRKTSPEEYRAYHQKKLQKKRDSKSKALKVKPETLQVFEMEYFSLKNLSF